MLKDALLAIMVTVAPPGMTQAETRAEGLERYGEIAEAIDATAETRLEASMLLSLAFFESGFRKDVDLGIVRGQGLDCGLYQVRVSRAQCDELVVDRARAARFALGRIRQSIRACRQLPAELQLAAYASGQCGRGWEASRSRMRKAFEWLGRLPEAPAGALLARGATHPPA